MTFAPTAKRARRRTLTATACVLLVLAAGAAAAPHAALAARFAVPRVFAGTALWVREVASGKNGATLSAEAARAGVRTLYVKAGDGTSSEPQFTSTLVREMRSAGTTVCAWTFMYGSNPSGEAAVAAAAVREGAQCLVIDAEGTVAIPNLYGAAQQFVGSLRATLGGRFPIGLAGQAETLEHPTFPYSVFLGPGGFGVVMPLIYWADFGQSVDAAYSATMGANALYGRPILPAGQLYGSPAPAELLRFRGLAAAYGAPGLSFFDLDAAEPQGLATLASRRPYLPRRSVVPPTLRPGADGDAVVEAQELLNASGAHLPVGGFFGAVTARAVASFQTHRHLRATGILDATAWRALLRFRPREPSWSAGPPASAR